MTWPINSSIRGGVEFLLVFPLLLLMSWGIGFLSFLLIQKSKMERGAWAYSISKSYKSPHQEAWENGIRPFFPEKKDASLKETSQKKCLDTLFSLEKNRSPLPKSFQFFLYNSCPEETQLKLLFSSPLVFQNFFSASQPLSSTLPRDFSSLELFSSFVVPGKDFKNSQILKQSLWQEAMKESGFGLLPLQMLGVPELLRAASFVGLGGLGSLASEILTQTENLPLLDIPQ